MDSLSLLDPRGKLFERDGRICRAIPQAHSAFFQRLVSAELLPKLNEVGLVGTRLSHVHFDGYPLVLEHDRIEFASYWREWPSSMLRDAAMMVCQLNVELGRHGLSTQDGHPWNVLMDYWRPVFVDFSSIVPLADFVNRWASEWTTLFRRCWVLPLIFFSIGRPGVARSMGRALDVDESIDRLLGHRRVRWFPLWFSRLEQRARSHPLRFFEELLDRLRSISLAQIRTEWSDYYKYTGQPSPDDLSHYGTKARAVHTLLEKLRPATVLDIGGNQGWYSIVAERCGARVVCFDIDEGCVNELYALAKSRGLRILPLVMDFTVPTPRHGRKVEFPSAPERLACDMTLMLALIHHLTFEMGLTFPRIAQLLGAFTRKHCVVEFVPPEDRFVAEWMRADMEWYRLDNFLSSMESHFRLEAILDSTPPRKILLFQKR